ncbi:hypothetical protein [Streptomyces sp. BV129]|uniref:hypothetical protein n=1 Tax=Streptomyces sp. BV129 TaxID=2849671 RepID=UPI001C2E4954|nr:hypothetical protein [Streptomyces sp. BV129]MBV1950101.1 hypothetical protein [Streptomyces sp. BV129]
MATFNIRNQSGQIQMADTINNGAVGQSNAIQDLRHLEAPLLQILEELRRQADATHLNPVLAGQAIEAVEEAAAEAARPEANPGRVRRALGRATEVLTDVATASALVGSVQAVITSLPDI